MELSLLSASFSSWLIGSTALLIYQEQESVRFIYALLFMDIFFMTLLVLQVFSTRLFVSGQKAKNQFQRFFFLMELLINFPVTLGVIGTLISISIAIAKAGGSNLSEVMNNNFDAAVVTTVIGGLVYGYCFLLQAVLYWYLDRPESKKI